VANLLRKVTRTRPTLKIGGGRVQRAILLGHRYNHASVGTTGA
jgi:hypothetical protein